MADNTPGEEFAFYESGLVAHGCLENLDTYTQEAIQRYGRILLKAQEKEINDYVRTIKECLRKNAHLADGEICTLIDLKRVLSRYNHRFEF